MPSRLSIFKRRVKDKLFGKTKGTAQGVQQDEMADARMGIAYFLGNMQSEMVPAFSSGAFGSFIVNPTVLGDLKKGSLAIVNSSGPGRAVTSAVGGVVDKVSDTLKPITDAIKRFFRYMMEKILKIFGNDADGMEVIGEYIVWAAAELSQLLTTAIPAWGYVQSAADMYEGASKAVRGAYRFIDQMYSGYGVELLGGHPSIIANALARHSLSMVGGGLKDIGIGAGKIALQAGGDAMAGVGSIFSAVTGALQRIANLVGRYIQRIQVNRVLDKAKLFWSLKGSPGSILDDHKKFSEWFQNAVVCTPIIAALVIGSGFAGHPYRFLQMLDSGGGVMSQSSFDKGVTYIDKLKSIAGTYVGEYTDAYRMTFVSDDALVKGRLQEILYGKQTIESEPEVQWTVNPLYQGA